VFSAASPNRIGQAFRCWFVKNSNPDPWIKFVPLRVWTLIAAPPASPCSASMLLVTMFTSSMDSSVGM
jgi:hypothetical protein